MKDNVKVIVALLLALSSCTTAANSTSKPGVAVTYKLIGLKVTGTERYTEKEILPASGLQLGQSVGEADFKEAVRRLGDTGLFTDVAYTFSYSAAGAKLELQLADVDKAKLVPALFENFVWFTDAELLRDLQHRVSLFKLALPEAGALTDTVERALQDILDEKQIPARVDYLRESPQEGGQLTGIAYRVEAMDIRVRNVEFPGATPDQLPALQAVARRLAGAPFMRSSLAKVAEVDFLPVCLQRGYLKASFASADARVATQSGADVEVDAIFPVTPGKVYSTSSVEWKGNSVFPSESLEQLLHLPASQPADAVRLMTDLERVEKLYHTRGYMAVHVTSKPLLDDDKATVHYDLKVVEGEQFKMGEFEVVGLDSQAKAHLQEAWKLNEGDPYNGEYAKKFLAETSRILPVGVSWGVSIHEAVNEKDKTVDVTIRFTPK